MTFINTPNYRHGTPETTGVLITNLGTPDAPTPRAVRRYLAEFLSDPRVVELPRLLWMGILHLFILNVRPRRSAKAYAQVWTDQGSPLLSIAKQQQALLQHDLSEFSPTIQVELAMRYGNPSIAQALARLRKAAIRRLLVFPLYPQYSATTTASTFDAVAKVLSRWRWLPELRMVMDYHQHEAWLDAVARSIGEHWQQNGRHEKLMMSFHGLPKRFLLNGDPYHCQCHTSARRIAEKLQLADDQWQLVFQSRFGREPWLEPYCDHTLRTWAEQGIKSVDIVCPGFSADCLETLEEVAIANRELFLQAGGQRYAYIPALNRRDDHIDALGQIIKTHLLGWPMSPSSDAKRYAIQQRAMALGARQ